MLGILRFVYVILIFVGDLIVIMLLLLLVKFGDLVF